MTSVSCGVTDPGPGPGPGPGGDLSVDIEIGHKAGEQGPFQNKDMAHIVINVKDSAGRPVSGAAVRMTIVTPKPATDLVGDLTTDADGVAHTYYKVNAGRDGRGTYHVHSEASAGTASGSCLEADVCHADFVVN